MYDPNYYCDACGKRMGVKSHSIIDRLGESYYESMMCRACEEEEVADDDSDMENICGHICDGCDNYAENCQCNDYGCGYCGSTSPRTEQEGGWDYCPDCGGV